MQTVDMSRCIEGIFVQELKNRFLCEVLINGISTVCYVPSSCHLSNFLVLKGKKVLLLPTVTPNARTRYSLFAIPFKRSYILLNTSIANYAVLESMGSRRLSFLGKRKTVLSEHPVEGYKADAFIEDTKTIVEIKSVLSVDETACFPTVYSERAIHQLKKLQELMEAGYNAHFIIVALNPYIKRVRIVRANGLWDALKPCIDSGMRVSAFVCRLNDDGIKLGRIIPIDFQDA